MKTTINETLVEWDDNKNRINFRKHGISFETALLIFDDKYRLEEYDYEHSQNEDRYVTIGFVHDVLTVVYTERSENIRLISARPANKKEREKYYGQNGYNQW